MFLPKSPPESIPPGRLDLDPTSAPWRTIESVGPDGAAGAGDDKTRVPAPRHLTQIAIIAVAGLVAVASFLVAASSGTSGSVEVDGGSPPASAVAGSGDPAAAPGPGGSGVVVVVEIVGAVQRPGVFRLPVGTRVGDLVDAAGGFGPRVDTVRAGSLNLAAILKDGDQVRVPSRDDAPSTRSSGGESGSSRRGRCRPGDLSARRPQPCHECGARGAPRDRAGDRGQDHRVAGG